MIGYTRSSENRLQWRDSPIRPCRSDKEKPVVTGSLIGAGGGNRTRNSCLEGKGITIMQRPRADRATTGRPFAEGLGHPARAVGDNPAEAFRL